MTITVKHLPGKHDQDSHGSWATGQNKVAIDDRIRTGDNAKTKASIKGDGKINAKEQVANGLSLLPANHKTNVVGIIVHDVKALQERGIERNNRFDVIGVAHPHEGIMVIAGKGHDELVTATTHEAAHLLFTSHPAKLNPDLAFVARRREVEDRMAQVYQDRRYGGDSPTNVVAITMYARTNHQEFMAENYSYYVTKPELLRAKDQEVYGIMKDFFQGQEYDQPVRTKTKEISNCHILPWWAARIYSIVARKELPIPAQQRRLSTRTSAYERELKALWEIAKAKLRSGELTAQEFARQMADLADGAFLEAAAEVLGVDIDELLPAQREMIASEATANRGFIQSSLLPDIVKAIADPKIDLGVFDYRIAVLYAGAMWKLGTLVTVAFDGLSLRDLGDLFLFAGPMDNRTCTGERGCDQHVGKVYPVAYILAEKILPGTLRCLHSCRHMLIPIASLPEKNRPKPSPVHSDIQHVYGAEKHLPGKHDQMGHGSWARRTPEGGKREPGHKKGDELEIDGSKRTVESLDYASRSGAKAWAKKQANAADLSVMRAPDGKYYVVSKPKAGGDAMTPDAPPGVDMAANDAKMKAYQNVPDGNVAESTLAKDLKRQVTDDLANATEESLSNVNKAIGSWANSSNDDTLMSLAMQEAAESEFGSKMTDWQKEKLDVSKRRREKNPPSESTRMPGEKDAYPFQDVDAVGEWPTDTKARTQKFLRAQYDATQAALKTAGVTHVTVYRGIGHPKDADGNIIALKVGDRRANRGNAMESWSTRRDEAELFPGHLVKAVIPIARIMSTPRTGLGCLREREVVVLGGVQSADVVDVLAVASYD